MHKLSSYIIRQVSLATIFIAVLLTAAIWLTQSLRFIGFVISKGLHISTFFQLTSLLLPNLFSLVLPAALLMGMLFVYNKLITDNELIVMRAVGFSPAQLLRPVLWITAVVMLILYMVNFYILPWSLHTLRELEHDLRSQVSVSMLQSGRFNSFNNLTIYVREMSPSGEVYGVIIHRAQEGEKAFTITANKGEIIKSQGETRLVLLDGIRHDLPKNQETPSSISFDQYVVDLTEESLQQEKRRRKAYEYSTWELLNPHRAMGPPSSYPKFIAQAHQRILGPLHALVFVLIGLSVLLAGDFNRRGRAKKNIVVASLCAVIQVSTITFMNLAEKTPLMIILNYLFIFSLIIIFLMHLYEKIDLDSIFGEVLS